MTITSPKRLAVRAGTVAALTSVPLLAAGSAFASSFQGEDAGPQLSVLEAVGIFVGIPVGLFLLISFLVLAPGWVRGDRNRAEIGWDTASAKRAAAAESEGRVEDEDGIEAGSEAAKAGAASGGTGGASGSW